MNYDKVLEKFDDYVSEFDLSNYDINYKYRHSKRVMELSNYISIQENFNDENVYLANVIGLLHDIGRFEQLKIYNSYYDKYIDHADLGSRILFQDGLINYFDIDKSYYDIIDFSIKNHNKYQIEKTNNEQALLQAKLIRDTDKIDIIKAFAIYKDFKLKKCSSEISNNVKTSFYNNKTIINSDVKNSSDRVISLYAFLFDINYIKSIEYIDEINLFDNLYNILDNQEMFKEYNEYTKKYIRERKLNYVR